MEATLYFEKGVKADEIMYDLRKLLEPIKPVYFTCDEGKINKKNILSDEGRFSEFLKANQLGFILYAKNNISFDLSIYGITNTELTMYLDDELFIDFVVEFLKFPFQSKPIFGYACKSNEYYHRNRYYKTIGVNHIETWIGRDLEKYIPGLYWYVLLSNTLLKKHQVNLADLATEALTSETFADRALHLLKFFMRPEDWSHNTKRLDSLCEKVDGIFSKVLVEKAIKDVNDYQLYSKIILDWR